MSDLRATITSANQSFIAAYNGGDAAAMAGAYTPDGQLFPPGSETVTGPAAIEGFWGAVMGMGIATVNLETVEVDDHGDTGIEIGRYTLGTAEGQTADTGTYLVVWKNHEGSWKLHRDIWNTDLNPEAG